MLETIWYLAFFLITLAVFWVSSWGIALTVRRCLMPERRKLLGERRKILKDFAIEEYALQIKNSNAMRQNFLDQYLGSANAIKREAWERAEQEPRFLRTIVQDHVSKLNDAALIELVVRLAPGGTFRRQLGFEPSDWQREYFESRRWFSKSQLIASAIASSVLVVMFIVPPWTRQSDDVTWVLLSERSRDILKEESIGYRSIFAESEPDVIENIATGDLGKTRQRRERTIVNGRRLGLQVFILFAGLMAVCFFMEVGSGRRSTCDPSPPDKPF